LSISEGTSEAIFQSKPLLYYITDRRQLRGKTLLPNIRRVINRGVDFVQIREKDLSDRQLFDLTRRVIALAPSTRCRVLVNGRADIALAAGAHGVHLPSQGLRLADLKSWLPPGFLAGVSIHSIREGRLAASQGADYVLLGPVFPTPSKAGYGPPLGLEYLRRARESLPLPVLALGGIRPDNIASVLSIGVAGVAGISLFQDTPGQIPVRREDTK
jgi:thiamine-phosphate pyrophosphorylase